jgi:hypothetical protein
VRLAGCGAGRGWWALDGGDGVAWREQAGDGGSMRHQRCPGALAPSAGAAQGRRLPAQAALT